MAARLLSGVGSPNGAATTNISVTARVEFVECTIT
jgi:hypothetical protein